jgi:hypothetical protein
MKVTLAQKHVMIIVTQWLVEEVVLMLDLMVVGILVDVVTVDVVTVDVVTVDALEGALEGALVVVVVVVVDKNSLKQFIIYCH